MSDLGCSGGRYTWSNNKSDSTFPKERMDWAIAKTNWCLHFGNGNVTVVTNFSSNHCAILISIVEETFHKRRLWKIHLYEASWANFDSFKDVLRTIWNKDTIANSQFVTFHKKLKHYMGSLEVQSKSKLKENGQILQ